MEASHVDPDRRAFAPLVEACREVGIGRTTSFLLAREGTLETFSIGRRRYVKIESLRSLPERLTRNGAEPRNS